LEGFSRYNFESESIFKFLLVFKVSFLMQYECMMSYNISALYVPHQKKKGAKYRWRMCSRWKITLIPMVSSNDMTYSNVVSVLAENTTDIYVTYITTYPPSDACAFNGTRTTLHTLREHIHVLRKRPQDIPRSPRPSYVVVASHTTDT
jgi:hypothetical protein